MRISSIWPQLTRGIFHTIWHHAQHTKLGKKEEGADVQNDGICLLKSPITHNEALLSWGWLYTCLSMETSLEWMFCFDLVVHALKCLYLYPWVFSLLFFQSYSLSHGGMSKQLYGAGRPSRVKPQDMWVLLSFVLKSFCSLFSWMVTWWCNMQNQESLCLFFL